jgi:hypothetical protein
MSAVLASAVGFRPSAFSFQLSAFSIFSSLPNVVLLPIIQMGREATMSNVRIS